MGVVQVPGEINRLNYPRETSELIRLVLTDDHGG